MYKINISNNPQDNLLIEEILSPLGEVIGCN